MNSLFFPWGGSTGIVSGKEAPASSYWFVEHGKSSPRGRAPNFGLSPAHVFQQNTTINLQFEPFKIYQVVHLVELTDIAFGCCCLRMCCPIAETEARCMLHASLCSLRTHNKIGRKTSIRYRPLHMIEMFSIVAHARNMFSPLLDTHSGRLLPSSGLQTSGDPLRSMLPPTRYVLPYHWA